MSGERTISPEQMPALEAAASEAGFELCAKCHEGLIPKRAHALPCPNAMCGGKSGHEHLVAERPPEGGGVSYADPLRMRAVALKVRRYTRQRALLWYGGPVLWAWKDEGVR